MKAVSMRESGEPMNTLATMSQAPVHSQAEHIAVLCSPRCSRDWEQELAHLGVVAHRVLEWASLMQRLASDHLRAVVVIEDGLGVDILRMAREIRDVEPDCMLILVGNRQGDFEEVLGLELGADVVLSSDVSARLVAAHLNAQRRRRNHQGRPGMVRDVMRFGALEIRRGERAVYLEERLIPLSSGEFELLVLLASRAGKVVSHDEALRALRGLSVGAEDRSIDARLYRLRRRFGNTEQVKHRLRSIRPNGYMFTDTAWT
jgi:two-component system, OmpR family, response regulator